MIREVDVYEELVQLKRQGIGSALAILIQGTGSSPQKAGAKMVVRSDGSIVGTVGGGQLEHETTRFSHGDFKGHIDPGVLAHGRFVEQLGAVCPERTTLDGCLADAVAVGHRQVCAAHDEVDFRQDAFRGRWCRGKPLRRAHLVPVQTPDWL